MKTDQTWGSLQPGTCTGDAGLSREIDRLRVQINRYLEAENATVGGLDYDARLSALRAVNQAAESLNRLVRLQTLLLLQSEVWK